MIRRKTFTDSIILYLKINAQYAYQLNRFGYIHWLMGSRAHSTDREGTDLVEGAD